MLSNRLIEASAGTGKTHALVERLVEALRAGAAPREIVALTFSRAAAGEIFSRFVTRLAQEPADLPLLRSVVETQHLSQIGTLDSFLVRYVQMFPLELGIGGDMKVLEGFAETNAAAAAAVAVLRDRDSVRKRLVLDAFKLVSGNKAERSWLDKYKAFVKDWQSLSLDRPGWLGAVGLEALGCAEDPVFAEHPGGKRALRDAVRSCARALAPLESKRGVATFIAALSSFPATRPDRVPKAVESEPAARQAVRLMCAWRLLDAIDAAHGLDTLLERFESEYDARVRSRGRLSFADIPRLVARLDPAVRLALEYRLDARIRHWALDEFQDTSRGQWNAISNLVDEAVQSADGERSVFIVGDCKQAIYGWRNGDVAIFAGERDSGRYEVGALNESWRYTKEIADAVNRVFGSRNMARFGKWRCPEHVAHDEKRRGFVKVVEAEGPDAGDFAAAVAAELNAVRPWERGIETAVLVRQNSFGEELGMQLRLAGIPCVWEGESAVLDTPVLRAFTALVRLAEHPGDELAYNHILRTPLARALYPGGMPPRVQVSREARDSLTTRGLVRTFQDARSRLGPDAWDDFTESRFADMLRAASAFELSLEPGTRLTSFIEYLEAVRRRGAAAPGSVRIMTIHHSKGLGFDFVILPLRETRGIDGASDKPLEGPGGPRGSWLLPPVGDEAAHCFGATAEAYDRGLDASIYESLCLYYVAMTRAKTALSIVTQPAPKKEASVTRFSDFIRESALETDGDAAWFLRGAGAAQATPTGSVEREREDAAAAVPPPPKRLPREEVRRRTPSLLFKSGIQAGSLFETSAGRARALARGAAAHAAWQQLEWLDPENARTPFELALVKPSGFVELWRERAYERFADGAWESGQLDRVVFTRESGSRLVATVYDFKTNAIRDGESSEAFRERMAAAYEPQMAAYRQAVADLASIPLRDVRTVLLLAATGDAATLHCA